MKELTAKRFAIAAPQTVAEKLTGIFAQAGMEPERVWHDGAQALAEAESAEARLLVTTWKLPDMTGLELAQQMGADYETLMIVPKDYDGETDDVMLLYNPVSQDALAQSVRALLHSQRKMDALRKKAEKLERTLEERKVIERAKGRLMDQLHLSESEAHYRIQKQSMDTGRRIVDVAREILEAETLE